MIDREKVAKAVECRRNVYKRCGNPCEQIGNCEYAAWVRDSDGEPYYPCCCDTEKLCDDILLLLKEQDNCENCAIAIEDRQPVVRCRDCRHYGYKDMTNVDGFCYCLKRHEYPNPDWYCGDGERWETNDKE